MSNGTVGVTQGAAPDRLIDNDALTVGAQTVYRQRVVDIPVRVSTYYSGASGSVNVPISLEIVEIVAHWTAAGSLTIGGGTSIPTLAGTQFSTVMTDAPIVGIGAGSVVFTGSDSYYVRVRPVVS